MKTEQEKAGMYFIAVVLPPQLDEKIRRIKQHMQSRYGCRVGLKSPAHITLAPPFWMKEEKEENLKRDMVMIAQQFNAFPLHTAGFSAFRPRTIFVALQKSEMLDRLKKTSDCFFSQPAYKLKIETRPFHPHITIATRDLHKKDFADAWPQFETKDFSEAFEAAGLSLLKHNGRAWDIVFTAAFAVATPAAAVVQP